jgi:solute carrier family 34 (sodium-dependent phosphate cotransporter)
MQMHAIEPPTPTTDPPPAEAVVGAAPHRTVWPLKVATAIVALFLFVLALELLKRGARPLGPFLTGTLGIQNATNTLGFGWLVAYAVLSGSPVAAIALSFFHEQVINDVQTFTMITGSRLGASFIVLFVGFLYYLRGHQRGASIAIGVLCLIVTATIYLPALVIGIWALDGGWLDRFAPRGGSELTGILDAIYDPILTRLDRLLSGFPWLFFFIGVGVLLFSFSLLDRALPEMHAECSAFPGIGRPVSRPAAMFLLGMAVTSVTLSVSVSLSILVPLSAKGLVRRENMVPYIMGANITTFIDTLFAALVMSGGAAFTIVLVEMLSVALISVVVLLTSYRLYERGVLAMLDGIMRDNRTLGAFVAVMLITPLALLFWRW